MSRTDVKGKIVAAAHHRNGIAGQPFHVAILREHRTGVRYLVVTFEDELHTAAFDLDKLAEGDIEFGSNSFRGDNFGFDWRDAILAKVEEQYAV